jgi:hypothetical protein
MCKFLLYYYTVVSDMVEFQFKYFLFIPNAKSVANSGQVKYMYVDHPLGLEWMITLKITRKLKW